MAASRGFRRLAAAAAGVASAVLGAGLGELTAAIIAPAASPFAVIGSALIDLAPTWAKDAAIALFGTNYKIALLTGIAIVLVLVAAGAGLLELWRPPSGRVVMLAFAAVGVVAAMTRAGAGPLDLVPSAVAGGIAAIALGLLMKRIPAEVRAATPLAGVPASVEGRRNSIQAAMKATAQTRRIRMGGEIWDIPLPLSAGPPSGLSRLG